MKWTLMVMVFTMSPAGLLTTRALQFGPLTHQECAAHRDAIVAIKGPRTAGVLARCMPAWEWI
jgi:hypothetical protein